jgi:hypothetical protein
VTVVSGNGGRLDASGFAADFVSAMDDNLNSPAAIGILDDLGVRTLVAAQAGNDITAAQRLIRALSTVFGLRLDAEQPEPRVMAGWAEHLQKFA